MVRVLCVDDNRDLADTNATLLRIAGYDVRVCYDGADAMIVSEEFHPDVCVLDLHMPGLPGEHLAVWIRAREQKQRPALIALTGYGRESDFRRTELAGFDIHLVKPVEPDKLLDAVRTLSESTIRA